LVPELTFQSVTVTAKIKRKKDKKKRVSLFLERWFLFSDRNWPQSLLEPAALEGLSAQPAGLLAKKFFYWLLIILFQIENMKDYGGPIFILLFRTFFYFVFDGLNKHKRTEVLKKLKMMKRKKKKTPF